MTYALENSDESERLERQSRLPGYDYRHELKDVKVAPRARVLDAGCGSGVVARHLAGLQPSSKVVGLDRSAERIEQARRLAPNSSNLEFVVGDVTDLGAHGSFDLIIFRYVLQHLAAADRRAALSSARAALKPGGEIVLIDTDGTFLNLFPISDFLTRSFQAVVASGIVDLTVGRKLPSLLASAGFVRTEVRIEAVNFDGEQRTAEVGLMAQRLEAARPVLEKILGEPAARKFRAELVAALEAPNSVYFHNRFVVTSRG